jgi:hypothetical protein
MGAPRRYSRVPWLAQTDLQPMGEPETYVILSAEDRTDGLHIPEPFGKHTDATLLIHAMKGNGNDGGTITLAIGTVIQTVQTPKGRTFQPYMDPPQTGQPRNTRSQPDGHHDDNGANDDAD